MNAPPPPGGYAPWQPRHGRPETRDVCDGCGMSQRDIDRCGGCECDREFDSRRDMEFER